MRVHFQVIEGERRRLQVFEGVVIKRQGAGVRETFTVRKQSFGVGVERTFPVHSPKIEKIERTAIGDVNRAKLYYLRGRVGKRARIREIRQDRSKAAPVEAVAPAPVEEPEPVEPEEAVEPELEPQTPRPRASRKRLPPRQRRPPRSAPRSNCRASRSIASTRSRLFPTRTSTGIRSSTTSG